MMTPNRTNHPPRKGLSIKAHKGGRTKRLPDGWVTESEWTEIEPRWKASGLSWADFVLWLSRNPTSFAPDAGDAPRFWDVATKPDITFVGDVPLKSPRR